MIYLLDGSNILGQLRRDRNSSQAKRELVQNAAAFARAKRAKVVCVFDGGIDEHFGTSLGAVRVFFSFPRSADEVIVEKAAQVRNEPVRVVTADSGLAARVVRRGVEVIAAADFLRMLESRTEASAIDDEDWGRYFSDPKNRNV